MAPHLRFAGLIAPASVALALACASPTAASEGAISSLTAKPAAAIAASTAPSSSPRKADASATAFAHRATAAPRRISRLAPAPTPRPPLRYAAANWGTCPDFQCGRLIGLMLGIGF